MVFRVLIGLITFLLVLIIPVHAEGGNTPSSVPLTQGWSYRFGNAPGDDATWFEVENSAKWRSLSLPATLPVPDNQRICWLALPLPDGHWSSPSLYFQGIPDILEAYLQNERIFTRATVDAQNNLNYTEGTFPIVSLPPNFAQKTLYIRIHTHNNSFLPLGTYYTPTLGDKPKLIRQFTLQDSYLLVLGILFIFCGLFPIIIAIITRNFQIYLSFGLFTVIFGIYTLSMNNLFKLILDYTLIITFLHHTTFHLLPAATLLFYQQLFPKDTPKFFNILWKFQLVYAPIAITLAGTKTLSWAQALPPTQLIIFLGVFLINIFSWKNASKANLEAKIFAIAFSVFLGTVLYDLFAYIFPNYFLGMRLSFWGLLIFVFTILVLLERRFTNAQKRLKLYNKSLERFVPHEFFDALGKESIIDVQLGDQVQKEMTILFSDIRNFTSVSESMSPKDNFDFLNTYLDYVGPVIRENQGFVDKYIGDAVMALFPDSPDDAIEAALAMQQQVKAFNSVCEKNGYPAINIGIGIHQGSLMLGTIGELERMETTVIADAVNLASRLEESTKLYGAGLLMSEKTLKRLSHPEKYAHRFLGKILVKGKREPVSIYEIYESDLRDIKQFKTETRWEFEKAIQLYSVGQLTEAKAIFQQLWEKNRQDRVVWSFLFKILGDIE